MTVTWNNEKNIIIGKYLWVTKILDIQLFVLQFRYLKNVDFDRRQVLYQQPLNGLRLQIKVYKVRGETQSVLFHFSLLASTTWKKKSIKIAPTLTKGWKFNFDTFNMLHSLCFLNSSQLWTRDIHDKYKHHQKTFQQFHSLTQYFCSFLTHQQIPGIPETMRRSALLLPLAVSSKINRQRGNATQAECRIMAVTAGWSRL